MGYINPQIYKSESQQDFAKCLDVRVQVFYHEQKYPLHLETEDPDDPICHHWVVVCDEVDSNGSVIRSGVPVGTVRLIPKSPKTGKLGRMAVISEARGLGLAKALVKALINYAASIDMQEICLEAQVDKQDFYKKLGFVVEKGDEEPYPVDGTPHVKMWKRSLSQ
ncbi:acyl-CoA N-acyltransferase [Syncephalastrum racemosum]|uniref:Acyl-CoA N-acyltransferase n=1 Tax=Syncephalastrum racemosum TaxID=13706 RepID=A0A1X2H4F8_SYNRA|nr:acyl-CoA N-acyltransferase [Syncephalastrum racemosum]